MRTKHTISQSEMTGPPVGQCVESAACVQKKGVEVHCETMLATIMCLLGKSDRPPKR
jgi:hypothetical protein